MSSKRADERDVIGSRSKPIAARATIRSSQSFPGALRLKKKRDFLSVQESVQRGGQKIYCKHFLLLIGPALNSTSRLGITVTTKVDKRAVARNRIKRCVREIFRIIREKLGSPIDIIVIARQGAPLCTKAQIELELTSALSRGGYL